MRPVLQCLLVLSVCSGCTTSLLDSRFMQARKFSFEQRVVNQFADAIREDKEPALRTSVSTRFEQKALRSETAFRDLEIVGLPSSPLVVVEVEELDDASRNVIVTEEDDDEKFQYRIIRDPQKHRWVVDDVLVRQQKRGARGTRSATEVMDLLLTLREFLDTWKTGDREAMLQVVATDLRSSLAEMPEPWMKQLIGRVAAEYESAMARRPEAQLNEQDAVVKMPARHGFLLVRIRREGDGWLVADVEAHDRRLDDHPGSIRRQADAINTVARFLSGYGEQDQKSLRDATTAGFYEESLQFADLSLLTLPAPDFVPEDYEMKAYGGNLTVMLPEKTRLVRMDLVDPAKQLRDAEGNFIESPELASPYPFVVRDVTIYDRKTMSQTKLSSAFSAPARGMLFMSALEARDYDMLKQISSPDLSLGTWDRISPEMTRQLPLDHVPHGSLQLLGSQVRGQKTELEFQAETGQLLHVLLSDDNGTLRVDDLQFPGKSAEIISLKAQLEVTIPLIEMANAWHAGDLEGVQGVCSREFNRLVWSNLDVLPEGFSDLPELLTSSAISTRFSEGSAEVSLQHPLGRRARIQLSQQDASWVIDEIIYSQQDGSTVQIRAALRKDIASRILQTPAGTVQQAGHLRTADGSGSGGSVVRAHAEFEAPLRGNLTLPSPRRLHGAEAAASTADGLPAVGPPKVPTAASETSGMSDPSASLESGPSGLNLTEAEEHNGVVYFRAGPGAPSADRNSAPLPSEARIASPQTSVPERRFAAPTPRRITDPSQYPIDIPR